MAYNIIKLCTYILSVVVCVYGLDCIDFSRYIKKHKVKQFYVLYIVIVLSLAYLLSSYILNFITISLI